jgi:hypothetical protein
MRDIARAYNVSHSSVIPSFCGLWGWRKERIGKGQNLVESNPGGRRRVRLLLSG